MKDMIRKKIFSIFIIMLFVSLPLNIGVFADDDYETDLPDPVQACIDKHEESSGFADMLDNDVINTLESLFAMAHGICLTLNLINQVMDTIDTILGLMEGLCCRIPPPAGPPACAARDPIFKVRKLTWKPIEVMCCFVSCGWCTGQKSCGGFLASAAPLGKIPGVQSISGSSGIGQFHLEPYNNIYTAVGCMCPSAILFNMRKLKTIYDTYDCCIQQACQAGESTEECEHFLSTSTCMYWEGSVYKSLVNVMMSFIAKQIAKLIPEMIFQTTWLNCILLAYDLYNFKDIIDNLKGAWSWASESFDEPICEDINMDSVKSQTATQNAGVVMMGNAGKKIDGIVSVVEYDEQGQMTYKLKDEAEATGAYWLTTTKIFPGDIPKEWQGMDAEKLKTILEDTSESGKAAKKELGITGFEYVESYDKLSEFLEEKDISLSINSVYEKEGVTMIDAGDSVSQIVDSYIKKNPIVSVDPVISNQLNQLKESAEGKMIDQNQMAEITGKIEGMYATLNDETPKTEESKDDTTAWYEKGITWIKDEIEGTLEKRETVMNDILPQLNEEINGLGTKTEVLGDDLYKTYSYEVFAAGAEPGEPERRWVVRTYYKGEEISKEVIEKSPDEYRVEQKEKVAIATREAQYRMAWQLLDMTLGKWAYNFIDEKCEDDWEASEPDSEEELDISSDIDGDETDQGPCKDIQDHSFTAQAVRTDIGESGYAYDYSASILACGSDLNYNIVLKPESGAGYTIDSGTVIAGETDTKADNIVDKGLYEEICIITDQEYCFPVVE